MHALKWPINSARTVFALITLTFALQFGLAACLLCTGVHQNQLKRAGCTTASCDAYCQQPSPAPPPPPPPPPPPSSTVVDAAVAQILESRCGGARRANIGDCLVCVSLRSPRGGCAATAAAITGGGGGDDGDAVDECTQAADAFCRGGNGV